MLLVRHPTERRFGRTGGADLADPRVIVQRVENARLARVRVDRHEPAVFVVIAPRARNRHRAVFRNERRAPADPALLAREAGVGPHRLARLEVHDGQQAPVLRVSDHRARRNVFDVAGFGDVIGHRRPLGGVGTLDDDDEHMFVVRGELEILRRLALLQLELRELALLLLLVGLLFLLFFGFDELLAVGLLRIALARPDVGQLDDAAWRVRRRGIDRDDEEIVFAREGHGRLTTRPARIRFGIRRARDLAARACHGIEEDDVALVGEQHAAVRRVPHAVGRWRVAPLGVREFARRAALARHDPRRRFVLARPPPLEIEPRRIAGPAQAARRIPDELGTAHDAVDGQLESGLGRRRRSRKVHGGDRDG